MVHGVSIRDGKAEWYRNRWVRTPCFFGQRLSVENALDIRCTVANTSVVPFGNRIFTLAENALPMEITRELDTVGFHDFGGALKTPFTAHPKICPMTGELHFFGYGSSRPSSPIMPRTPKASFCAALKFRSKAQP